MRDREYADFDLAIREAGDGTYRATVVDSPAGQGATTFTWPFSAEELEILLLTVSRPRGGTRGLETAETAKARQFGAKLFTTVFSGDVGVQWLRSMDRVEGEGKGLRLRLRLDEAPSLPDIPWEYLHSPAINDFVALSSWTPIVRYPSLAHAAAPLAVMPPLRILAVVSDPSDYPPLDVEGEMAELERGLARLVRAGRVEVERVPRATLSNLQKAVRGAPFHVFHFIGHGAFDRTSGEGVLVLEGPSGRGQEVSGQRLVTILDDQRSIRLAVLNACEGARSSVKNPFAGVATSLVFRGIPAVVAMQFEISDEAAKAFSEEFYTVLSGGAAVEAAVAEARRAIFGARTDVEWGTPVLYLRGGGGRLFDFMEQPPALPPIDGPADPAPTPPTEHPPADLPPAVHPPAGGQVEGRPPPPPPSPDWTMAARFLALPRPKQGASLVALLVIVGLALVVVGSVLDGSPTTGPTDVVVDPSATDGPASEDPVTEGPATEDPATEDPPTEDPPTEDPPTEDPVQLVDADLIVWPVPADVAIDGDLGEWPSSAVRPVDLPHNVLNDLPGTRQGQDAEAMVYAAYDEQSLYLAAEVDDDVYAQPNVDNQIWRGDALDINLVTDGQAPPRPSTSTFQITLTPRSGDGRPGHVWFVGNGQVFDANRTDLAIDVAGAVDADGDWRVEARIPWSVVGLRAAPTATLPGIVAVFDNDGETGSSGQSLQVAILTNVPQVLFQEPPTWGTIGLQR